MEVINISLIRFLYSTITEGRIISRYCEVMELLLQLLIQSDLLSRLHYSRMLWVVVL
jgi:hypothetical protein